MSWSIRIRRITSIDPIEGADRIELATVGGWPCVVPKGDYQVGDLVSYFPVDSIIPERWLEEWGLSGKLGGNAKNRVTPVRLRGTRSVGIICPAPTEFNEGDDVQDYYGIVRYEPPIPVHLSGKVRNRPQGFAKYDVENFNNEPDLFNEGELVSISEKIHGTNVSFGLVNGEFHVCSRNMSLEEDDDNLYWKIANKFDICDVITKMNKSYGVTWLHGEIFGRGAQDLHYGQNEPTLALFDMRIGERWLTPNEFFELCKEYNLPHTPVLHYETAFSHDLLDWASGNEMVSGSEMHIREGIVIKSCYDSFKKLKVVSNDYLFRKGGTEYH